MSFRYGGRKSSSTAGYGRKTAWPIVKKDKYSIETTFVSTKVGRINPPAQEQDPANPMQKIICVPAVTVQGMRKVKHLEVTLAADARAICVWALVYVPQVDIALPNLTLNTNNATSLYEPNQFVMMSGTTDFIAGTLRFRTPMARNLNSGDAIVLLIRNITDVDVNVRGTVRYAITLQ